MLDTNVVIDTNLLLDDANIIFKLSNKYKQIVIPITVLKELDKHKFKPDTSYSARNAIQAILRFKTEYPDKIKFVVTEDNLTNNDIQIINSAKYNDAVLTTKDISMSIIAESMDVRSKLYNSVMNGFYNPYIELDENSIGDFNFAKEYKGTKYYELLEFLDMNSDSWFFVFIGSIEEGEKRSIYANNPIKQSIERIDNVAKYRTIKYENDIFKALDEYQVCAFYALQEAPNVLLTGKWGSGKTLLATAYAVSNNDRKTFITRPPVGINQRYDIGFLPGDLDQKMSGWFAGFMSALYYLYANTRGQVTKGINYDFVKEQIFKDKFETVPINAIQGMSLLKDDMLIVDEIQLIDIDYLSMILSRGTSASKLVMLGDLSQTYNVVKPSESGLLKLMRVLPHRSLCHVELKRSYRSELIELADKLQDKTVY